MYERYIKRGLDFTGASLLLLITSPLFLIIAIAIKLDSKGPVIFKQERTGKGGKPFLIRKFRSMASTNNVHDRSKSDSITPIGGGLRALSLDELPQLINVVRGDMSFIGPRPWITAYYDRMNDEQRRRYHVRPGITGLAQVFGRNNLTIHEKIDYDLRYVDHIGLREDAKVVVLTFLAVLSKEGEVMGKDNIHGELDELAKHNGRNEVTA